MSEFRFDGDMFKPKPIELSKSVPSSADLTSLFTDAWESATDMFKQLTSDAKTTTLGASFMENASQIMGLAVLLIGIALYIQIKNVRDNDNDKPDKNTPAVSELGDKQNTVSKKVMIELFSGAAAAAAAENPNPNPHDTPALANRTGSTMTNISNGKINFDDIISDSISTIIPAGPSDATRSKLQDVSRACGSTNEFCKHNQSDLQKACGDITNQSSCAQKCCCGWVKFGDNGDKGDKGAQGVKGGSTMMSDARSSALNGFGISPDGKCVAGGASGPELTFNRDIDYYYYMGECMKGVCKSKGT